MPEKSQEKKPQTLDELEQELDKDALSPEVIAVESQPAMPDMPPGPREAIPGVQARPKQTIQAPISDADLQAAAKATEDEEVREPESEAPLPNQSLHVDPKASRTHFWHRKKFWFTALFLFILFFALVWLIRPTRLILVNILGLRADVSIATVTLPEADQQSSLIKKVRVEINGASWESDDHGLLHAKLPYGDTTFVAKKQGYEQATKTLLLDFDPFFYLFGGHQQDETARKMNLQLKVVGLPLKFQVKDWLTGEPIPAGAFSVGEAVAKPDNLGIVSLTVPATDAKKIMVKAMFGGKYIDKEFELPLDRTQQTITFVPEGKDYFVSKRSGGLAVYSSNLDGTNITEVVPANPNETSSIAIAVSPSGKYGLLASTRDGKRDEQGALQQQLYIVDLSNKKLTSIDQGRWFKFRDWQGDTLVYSVSEHKPGAAEHPERLSSIDAPSGKRIDLEAGIELGTVRVALGSVVYQVNTVVDNKTPDRYPELKTIPYRGGSAKSLGYKITQLTQTDFDVFVFQLGNGNWSEYNVNTSQAKSTSAPQSPNRFIGANPTADGQNKVVVDTVDGKETLLIKNAGNGQEKQLYSAVGVGGPIRLIGDVVLFRRVDGGKTTDYVVSIKGGTPKKVTDVTPSNNPPNQGADVPSLFW